MSNLKIKELIRFIVVGIFSTLINFLVYYFFISINLIVELSAIIGYVTGIFISFIFGKIWVFSNHDSKVKIQLIKFFILYIFSLTIYTIIISHYNQQLGKIFSWFIAISISTIINFIGSKYVVFK